MSEDERHKMDAYLAMLEKMEPVARYPTELAMSSAAVSLVRIADALDGMVRAADALERFVAMAEGGKR